MSELDALRAQLRATEERLRAAEMRAAIVEREAELQQRQALSLSARLSTILSISAALLIGRDVDAIVQRVVTEAVGLFPGTMAAHLYLLDPDHEVLSLRAVAGGGPPTCAGLARMATLAPRAMLLVGPELELALAELADSDQEALRAALPDWPPTSALLTPLRVESQRLGALVLYGGISAHLYHPRDIPFVQALADLTAVAIDEITQRARAAALQRDLQITRSLHAETQARLSSAQAQLLQSAKLAAVGELSASIAHEINNPLYAARNSLYLVEQDLPPDAPQRPYLAIAQQELSRIARIITRMRDFYRPTRAELAPTNINAILRETLELVQTHLRHGHITTSTVLDPDLPPIVAHADQLRQVFLNIILNACDAMPGGGELRVVTRLLRSPAAVSIVIQDTGIGIAPEHRPHLFEPFYTTKAQGTGLGLAISAHIVTQHGGSIDLESEPGRGTAFTILLPVEEERGSEG